MKKMILIWKNGADWNVSEPTPAKTPNDLELSKIKIRYSYPSKIHAVHHAKAEFKNRDIFLRKNMKWESLTVEREGIEKKIFIY